MKPFSLELAKLGHPLVTRDGQEVIEFHYSPVSNDLHPIITVIGGYRKEYYKDGNFNKGGSDRSGYDLFLKDCDWQPPLKMGDEIEVSDDGKNWEKQIFVTEANNIILTINKYDFERIKKSSRRWCDVVFFSWKHTRRIGKSPLNEVSVSELIAELNKRTGSNLVIDSMNDDGITIKGKCKAE